MQLEAVKENEIGLFDRKGILRNDGPRPVIKKFHWIKAFLFICASYLTDPACKVREWRWRLALVDHEHPDAARIYNLGRQVFLVAGIVGWALLATVMSLSGCLLRGSVARLQKDPYTFSKQLNHVDKVLAKNKTFTMLSWNICCVAGGYAITDGGVSPWADRIDAVVDKIIETNADINCLYETFDTTAAYTICNRLKEHGYGYVYYNIGPRTFGVSSGILIASKFEIRQPEFTPFPVETLVGRTKNATKGVLAFDVCSEGESFARIHATHLQHSEIPQFPTDEERFAREAQMRIISAKVDTIKDRCVIVTGDLNLDDEEFEASSWKDRFVKNGLYGDQKTWGGDAFCAGLVGREVSGALNLDHTMVVEGSATLFTNLIETGYDAKRYNKNALSDHEGLFSVIILNGGDYTVCSVL